MSALDDDALATVNQFFGKTMAENKRRRIAMCVAAFARGLIPARPTAEVIEAMKSAVGKDAGCDVTPPCDFDCDCATSGRAAYNAIRRTLGLDTGEPG